MSRADLPFRSVNRRGDAGHQPDLQRHHLLPRQLLQRRSFVTMFERIGLDRLGFDDFRRNGLLLPASEASAVRTGLPLHRGPHRTYNALVIERVGQIEAGWRAPGTRDAEGHEALARLALLQRALRRRLLAEAPQSGRREAALLSRRDPARRSEDFAALDALADELWPATEGP